MLILATSTLITIAKEKAIENTKNGGIYENGEKNKYLETNFT